jgi:hypothetical protein
MNNNVTVGYMRSVCVCIGYANNADFRFVGRRLEGCSAK